MIDPELVMPVLEKHGVTLDQILGRNREHKVCRARADLAQRMWKAKVSKVEIAKELNRHYSTIEFILSSPIEPIRDGRPEDLKRLRAAGTLVPPSECKTKEKRKARAIAWLSLAGKGWSLTAIARTYGVSPSAVLYHVRKSRRS